MYDPTYQRAYRAKKKATGLCRCGRPPEEGFKSCKGCLAESRAWSTKRAAKRRAKGLCVLCGKTPEKGSRCEHCRQTGIRWTQRLKARIIVAYGGKCVCCGEAEPAFLSIDHVNGGGKKHRKEMGTNRIYKWLEERGYPKDGFQLLCFNCNCGRRVNGGICPHQLKR